MEAKVHRRVQRYGWDLAVDAYEQYWLPVLRQCSDRCVEGLKLRPGERVLDIATGTGIAAFMAAQLVGEDGEVVATDISENMVRRARENAERLGIGNMVFDRVDAEDLRYPDASFDAALCVLGLMYPAEPDRAIAQMHRVLRPGGRAAACVWGRRDRCGWNAVFPIIDNRVQSDVCPLFFSLGAEGGLRFAFERAGFRDCREERLEQTLVWKSAEEACSAIFPGGPVALAYSRFSPEEREAVHAEYLNSISGYYRDGAYHVPGEFVFMVATRS